MFTANEPVIPSPVTMSSHARHGSVAFVLLALGAAACGDDESSTGTGTSSGTGGAPTCDPATLAFEVGDANGHPDPFGAKAAGQARAGRVKAADAPRTAHGRQTMQDGDFVLANDQVAIFIEDKGKSDGYGRFGGEILAVDRVGDDGKPLGRSFFLETLQATSLYMIDPESVSVLADGSDGGAAIVRVTGKLAPIPFIAESFAGIFPKQYEALSAAYDYVLEPGAEKVDIRFGLVNADTSYKVDTGLEIDGSWELLGMFQGSMNKVFTTSNGFGEPAGLTDFAAYEPIDPSGVPFAFTGADGAQIEFGGIDISGFQVFANEGVLVAECSQFLEERYELVIGEAGSGIDGLREVARRAKGESPWREVTGKVLAADGAPIADALVHVEDATGQYLTRARTGADGSYLVHVPDGEVAISATKRGYPTPSPTTVGATDTSADVTFDATGFVHVVATDAADATGVPVRIQVIPASASTPTMWTDAWGVMDEVNGRLHQEYSVTGDATLPVPVGEHRVIVSRGYEWELVDTTVTVAAGATVDVAAALVRTVDTANHLSADFHIHSAFSADSNDPHVYKVKGALADGLEIPVSSEHEWITNFQPIIEDLGAKDFAFGIPSEELTTFTWGHFGVVPILPRPEKLNNGAMDWLGKSTKDIFSEIDALPEKPALIVNHPSGDSSFSSYFSKVKLDRATGSSDDALWDENFDAIEVFNESDFDSNRDRSVADWFALLNAGKMYWAIGSSDSHYLRTAPLGYPRTYLELGIDDPKLCTQDAIRDAVAQGRSVISGGLFLTVEGPDGSRPGDIVTNAGASADFTVTVQAPSWIDADSLEVIVNGDTQETVPLAPVGMGPGKRFVNSVTVPLPSGKRSWVVFHAKGDKDLAPVHPGHMPFAVSNPILFEN